MLHTLLLLFVLIAAPGAAEQIFNVSSKFNISSCPITYFGQKYEEVYANFTNEIFTVCFNGYYNPQTGGDCLLGPQTDIAAFDIISRAETVEQLFLQNLPTINTSMECYIRLALSNDLVFTVVNFGSQAALGLQLTVAVLPDMMFSVTDVLLNGNKVNKLSVPNKQQSDYLDISACRHKGVVYETNTTNIISKYCETVHCNDKAVLSITSCGPMETCNGNNKCVFTTPPITTTTPTPSICTVTGASVIDFSRLSNFVKDQCSYYLLKIHGFSVVGHFLEHHLGDVSFLDSVWLKVNNVHIHLKQGGRVLVNDTTLDLNSSPQTVDGVVLSKDHTGVTAMMQINNLKSTVFFDGYTAQIIVEGSIEWAMEGLCENSSSEAKLSDCSSMSCVPHDNYIDEEMICPNHKKSEYKGVIVPGHWNYTLYMKLYRDYGCTKHVDSNTPIRLNEQVWVKLSTQWLDEDVLVLVTDHCWATDQPSPFAEKKYDLIVDGCPADPTVILRGNGKETFNYFAFNMFEFTRGSNQIHLHCEMQLCVKNTNMCELDCDRKHQRRSAMFKYDYLSLISTGWTS